MKKIIGVIKKNEDKILHFLGCGLGAFISVPFALGGAVYIEVKDFFTYGLKELKSKDKTRIQVYLKNTIGDLVADLAGILTGGTIWKLLTAS